MKASLIVWQELMTSNSSEAFYNHTSGTTGSQDNISIACLLSLARVQSSQPPCLLPQLWPPSLHSPPSLFLKRDYPPPPARSWGSAATRRGPLGPAGEQGRRGGLGERRWQVKWLGGRGGAIIYRNSAAVRLKEKEGEVARPCLSSVSSRQAHLSCTMAGRLQSNPPTARFSCVED